MREVGVGVIGLGVGERHVHGFLQHPQVRLVALCDIDPVKRAVAAARWPGARICATHRELIADDDVSIVSIASYDDAHFEQARMALELGKHIFVEKPICMHAEELAELRRLHAASSGLQISSNLILRRCERFLDLRDRIRRGEFGRVFHINADYNYGRLHKIVDGWRGDIPYYSVVLGGMIHLVDLVLWLSGDRIVEVSAMGNRIASAGSRFRRDDLVMALARCQSGLVIKLGANFGCVMPHFHRLTVYGTEATFENRLGEGVLWRSRALDAPPERLRTAYPAVDKGELLPDFVEAVLTGRPPIATPWEVFDTMAVCLAIEKASCTGVPVRVEY